MKLYIRLCKCGKFDADHTKQKNGENMKIMENNQNAGKYFAERKKQKMPEELSETSINEKEESQSERVSIESNRNHGTHFIRTQ